MSDNLKAETDEGPFPVRVAVMYRPDLAPVTYEFHKTDYYCPSCGERGVWEEQGSGDCYIGVDYCCSYCGLFFNLPSGVFPVSEKKQRIVEAIREKGWKR